MFRIPKLGVIFMAVGFWMLSTGIGMAAEKKDMGGWEIGSPYNQHYNKDIKSPFSIHFFTLPYLFLFCWLPKQYHKSPTLSRL